MGAGARRAAVGIVAVLALLPVADWIPGDPGSTLPPPHWPHYLLWTVGAAGIAALAWGVAALLRGRPSGAGPAGQGGGRLERVLEGWGAPVLLLGLPALLYAFTAASVFDRLPLHVDGLTQAFQARLYATGRLAAPAAGLPAFHYPQLLIERGGEVFSQFPPGWAALLAIGMLLGVPWFVAPLLGAGAVYALWWLARECGEDHTSAFFMAAVLALSPWWTLNAGSWMSHVPTTFFLVLGSASLVRAVRTGAAPWALLASAALGVATLIRPLEGVAFGLPATLWVLAHAVTAPSERRPASLRVLAGFAVGGLTLGALLAYNAVMHGGPTVFGFELQWGPEHRLGFHEAPWGEPHTFVRGVELVNGYLLALQLLFFDAPAPSLLLTLTALLVVPRLSAPDRYLLAGSGLLLLGYLSFWGEGHYLGPRYLIPLAPVVAIWTVRFGGVLAERTGRPALRSWGHAMVLLLLAAGWVLGTPPRWRVHRQLDPLRRVEASGLGRPAASDALVFVPAPWSVQVQSKLVGTGMPIREAEWFYHRVGLCKLDVALGDLRERGIRDPDSVARALLPLTADSLRMVHDYRTGSPGDPYTGLTRADSAAVSLCALRQYLEQAQGGYLLLPFQAQLGPAWTGEGVIVARDLHELNPRLIQAHPGREPSRLRAFGRRGRVRQFVVDPLNPDSVARVWSRFEQLHEEATVLGPPPAGR